MPVRVQEVIYYTIILLSQTLRQFLQFSVLVKSPTKLDHDSIFILDVTVNVQHEQHLQRWFQDTSQ